MPVSALGMRPNGTYTYRIQDLHAVCEQPSNPAWSHLAFNRSRRRRTTFDICTIEFQFPWRWNLYKFLGAVELVFWTKRIVVCPFVATKKSQSSRHIHAGRERKKERAPIAHLKRRSHLNWINCGIINTANWFIGAYAWNHWTCTWMVSIDRLSQRIYICTQFM